MQSAKSRLWDTSWGNWPRFFQQTSMQKEGSIELFKKDLKAISKCNLKILFKSWLNQQTIKIYEAVIWKILGQIRHLITIGNHC